MGSCSDMDRTFDINVVLLYGVPLKSNPSLRGHSERYKRQSGRERESARSKLVIACSVTAASAFPTYCYMAGVTDHHILKHMVLLQVDTCTDSITDTFSSGEN